MKHFGSGQMFCSSTITIVHGLSANPQVVVDLIPQAGASVDRTAVEWSVVGLVAVPSSSRRDDTSQSWAKSSITWRQRTLARCACAVL